MAVDALGPDETARLRRHLDGCPSCQDELAALEPVVGAVLRTSRPAPVDRALVDRILVARRRDMVLTEPDEPALVDSAARPSDRLHRRSRTLVAVVGAAAAALVLGVVAGLLIGRSGDTGTTVALERVGVDQVSSGVLSGQQGEDYGTVVVTAGDRPTLLVTLDHARAGVRYGCQVRLPDGTTVEVGSWTPTASGDTTWAVALDSAAADAREVLLTGPSGSQVATATLS